MATHLDWVAGIFIAAHITIVCVSAQNSLSAEDKQELLDAHNMFRGMVNPSATNMLRMEWNDELASIAQTYAAQCRFEHNDQRDSQSPSYTFVGENIFVTSSQSADYTGAVRDWYNEVADYNYSTNGCSRVCGHYTQVVWATSDMVGCGVARCAMVTGFSEPNSLLLICNYGPAGNINGQLPYRSGTSCSACPAERSTCLQNLCSATEATSQPATTSEIPEGGSAELTSVPTTVGATTATPNPPTTAAPPTTATPPSATTPPNTVAPPTIAIIAMTANTGTTATIATSEIPEGGSAEIPEGGSAELTSVPTTGTTFTIANTATTGTTSTIATTATPGTTSTIANTATTAITATTANTAAPPTTAAPSTTATTSPSSTPTTASTSSPSARPLPLQLIRLLLFRDLSQNPFARIILLRYLRRYRYRFRLRIG